MEPCIRVGIDVGSRAHRVGVAGPDGALLDEFDISHTREGFQAFFQRVRRREEGLQLPVAAAMWNPGTKHRLSRRSCGAF
jgi:hypothetical protein